MQIGSFIQTILGDVTVKYVKHWFVAFGKKKRKTGENYLELHKATELPEVRVSNESN